LRRFQDGNELERRLTCDEKKRLQVTKNASRSTNKYRKRLNLLVIHQRLGTKKITFERIDARITSFIQTLQATGRRRRRGGEWFEEIIERKNENTS
jgi:hypothetical protein